MLAKIRATIVFVGLLATAPVVADEASSKDFDTLVKKGDQARIAGNWSDALEAYAKALELRDDYLVAGRVGLVLVAFREYETAAAKLLQAVESGAGASDAERMRFFQAYVVAKKQVCRLDVIIVQTGVKFEIDGESRLEGRHDSWTFIAAGKHKLRASLEGFEEQTIEIDAPKGGQLAIKFDLRPVKPKEEHAKQPDPEPPPKAAEPPLQVDKPAAVIVKNNPSALTNSSRTNGSFVFGLGLGFVFEATPTPAMGPHAFIAWRSRSWWEVGVDARVAWTFVKDERFPTTQFVTWSAMVVPCGRWRRPWFVCGLVQVDGAQRASGEEGLLFPGLGIRGGVEFETHKRLSLQLAGDVTLHHRGFLFQRRAPEADWTGSLVTGTLGLRVLIKP